MLFTELTKKAIDICLEAHKGQRDKGDLPYAIHPFHLADQMKTEAETCTALLHDVKEDAPWAYEKYVAGKFPTEVIEALQLLTHDKDTDYLEYVERLSGNRLAARVKLADLRHNSTPGRKTPFTDKDRKRLQKYLKAQAILTGGEYDLKEMTLSLRYEIPPLAAAEKEKAVQNAGLTIVHEPDGSVRRYEVTLPDGQEVQEFHEFFPLLSFLEKSGYSAAHAASLLCE